MRLLVIFLVSFFLVGCKNGTVGRGGSAMWQMTASDSEKYVFYRGQCVQLGIKLNTPEMDACIASKPNPRRRNIEPLDPVMMEGMNSLGKPTCRDGRLPDPTYGCGQLSIRMQTNCTRGVNGDLICM